MSQTGPISLRLTLARCVAEACDRFEADWKAGRRPRIENLLAEPSGPERAALLGELLALEVAHRRRAGEAPLPDEYRTRFPGNEALIQAAFEETEPAPRAAPAARPGIRGGADRNLLFGILALQMDFIGREALIAAMHAWVLDKAAPLGRILVEHGALTEARRGLLESLVDEHLQQHGDDPGRSLAAVGPAVAAVRRDLEGLTDADVQASLAPCTTQQGDPDEGSSGGLFVGRPTSGGARFRVLRPHARGGLGEVSIALDEELNREVALKQMHAFYARDPRSRARFLLEAEVTGSLEHPGIVPIYGLGHDAEGRPYYAMRFIRGESLKQAIANFHGGGGPVGDPDVRSVGLRKLLTRFVDICDAVAYAHSRGILHRDLKPANVMLGPFGETLVVDWGLAKPADRQEGEPRADEGTLRPRSAADSSATLPGSPIGTPGYMSPEQAAGRHDRLGPASDVYSLGATLYCLLTGRPPFEERDVGEILQKVRRGNFPAPRALDRSIPPALEAVCLKAMAAEPHDRYASPRELADDLEHWMADEPVSARRDPWVDRVRRRIIRHRTAFAAGAAAALVAIACLAAATTLLTAANRRERQANTQLAAANRREREAKELAQRQFDLALEAVETYYQGASEDVLLRRPELSTLREELLRTALDFYQQLRAVLREGVDDGGGSRARLADVCHEVGIIMYKVGSTDEALEAFREGLAIREELAAAGPADPEIQKELAWSCNNIAFLERRAGRIDESLTFYRRALAIRERLAAALPDDPEIRRDLAISYNNFGLFQDHAAGRPDEALRYHRKALAIRRELVDEGPDDPTARRWLARSHFRIGGLQAEAGQLDEALHSLEQATGLQGDLVAGHSRHPDVADHRSELAETLQALGALHAAADRPSQAMDASERALAIRESLVEALPAVASYRRDLLESYRRIGALHRSLGRPSDAARMAMARLAMEPSDPVELSEIARELARSIATAGGGPLDASGTVSADRRSYTDAAVEALRLAARLDPPDLDALRGDPELGPLRPLADFQMLLQDLAFPHDPFASAGPTPPRSR